MDPSLTSCVRIQICVIQQITRVHSLLLPVRFVRSELAWKPSAIAGVSEARSSDVVVIGGHIVLGHIRDDPDSMWYTILVLDGGSRKLHLYSRQGLEQLLMGAVAQSDLLICFGSHCIKIQNLPPFLKMVSEVEPTEQYRGFTTC